MNVEELKALLMLLRDARHRIANKSQAGTLKADFLRLDKPVLEQLDAQIIKVEAKLVSLQQRAVRSRRLQERAELATIAIVAALERGANTATRSDIMEAYTAVNGVSDTDEADVNKVLQNMIETGYVTSSFNSHQVEIFQRVKQ
jgi:hypothetical protein